MITKAQVKHIRSLDEKKYRNQSMEFVIEGSKMIDELIESELEVEHIYGTESFLENRKNIIECKNINFTQIESFELDKISFLSTPNQALALAKLPMSNKSQQDSVALLLDSVQDPGNVGSIIRIADWFGINKIYMNHSCADAFSPKVVQASMGSIFRVNIFQTDLLNLLENNSEIPVFATTIDGTNLNEIPKISKGFIIIGNESNGVSTQLINHANKCITIPRIGQAESLNAAIATGIVCNALLS